MLTIWGAIKRKSDYMDYDRIIPYERHLGAMILPCSAAMRIYEAGVAFHVYDGETAVAIAELPEFRRFQ